MDGLTREILTIAANGADRAREGAGDCVREKIVERESKMAVPDLALIRRAILSVIDDGCTCESGEKHPWELDGDPQESSFENEQRLRFADAIQKYIVDRLAPALKGKGEQ